MNEPTDTEALIDEVARYLEVVDAFRAADCEPTWRPELYGDVEPQSNSVAPARVPSDIELH